MGDKHSWCLTLATYHIHVSIVCNFVTNGTVLYRIYIYRLCAVTKCRRRSKYERRTLGCTVCCNAVCFDYLKNWWQVLKIQRNLIIWFSSVAFVSRHQICLGKSSVLLKKTRYIVFDLASRRFARRFPPHYLLICLLPLIWVVDGNSSLEEFEVLAMCTWLSYSYISHNFNSRYVHLSYVIILKVDIAAITQLCYQVYITYQLHVSANASGPSSGWIQFIREAI